MVTMSARNFYADSPLMASGRQLPSGEQERAAIEMARVDHGDWPHADVRLFF